MGGGGKRGKRVESKEEGEGGKEKGGVLGGEEEVKVAE